MDETQSTRQSGFTLIEVVVAIGITAFVMSAVYATLHATMVARTDVVHLSSSASAAPKILSLMERDLHGLWHANIAGNRVLSGRSFTDGTSDTDRIDFLTTSDAIQPVADVDGRQVKPSICEVGYWVKDNRSKRDLKELWRREEPGIDNDLRTGGRFQLVHDRVRSLNITYYEELGFDAEPYEEWDSRQRGTLPRRIKIELTVERQSPPGAGISAEVEDFGSIEQKYVRHVVFDARYPRILGAGVALIPTIPGPPQDAGGGGEGGGGGGEGDSGRFGGGSITSRGEGGSGEGGRGGGNRAGGGRPPGGGRGGDGGNLDLGDLLRGGRGGSGGLFGSGGR